ncbi:deubiquitinating VCIP135, partial, partial [Paramuricea clavata]
MNGDRTSTQSNNSKGCTCGFKHFWDGNEYDNVPKVIDVSLEWNGKKIEEQVFWFDNESDPSLNSNVYEMATSVVQKHFPGEFGSETVVRRVVDKILRETELKKNEEAPARLSDTQPMDTDDQQVTPTTPSKIILTGPKHKTLHKEELTMNEAERLTKARITHRAAFSEKRKSAKQSPEKLSGGAKHGKQETQKAGKENTKPQSMASATKPPPQGNPSQAKPSDVRIRLTSSSGKTATITLKPSSTYADLQETILAELGIPNERQKIRYGFPPRVLKAPEDEHATLPLTNGDRVSVEELPDLKAQEEEQLTKEPETESMDVEVKGKENIEEDGASSSEDLEGVDRENLASDLLSILQGALKVDQWESVKHKPELFDRGGMIYDQIVSKLGPLRDDMHCNVTGLPGKTLAYNAKEDRFEICLGQKHIRVQPLGAETSSQARACASDAAPLRRPRDEREGLGAFSGALRHRDASEGRAAFSGAGRTLGGSTKTDNEQ